MTSPRPCTGSTNPAFIDPGNATALQLRAARRTCSTCPALRECALEALHAGNTLDGHVIAPAKGVFQAGITCKGNRTTARQLAAAAGVPVPTDYRKAPPRPQAPNKCVECGRHMIVWTRGEIPETYVMHYARGYCTHCRGAYKRALNTADDRRETRTRREAAAARAILGLPEPISYGAPKRGRAVETVNQASALM